MSQRYRKGSGSWSPTRSTTSAGSDLETDSFDEIEATIEELREFLSADFLDVPADPAFKAQLREKLRRLIRSRAFGYGPSED